MADSPSARRPLAQRLWWMYLLTAAVFFAIAIWLAVDQRPSRPLYVVLTLVLGLANLVMGVGFRRERRRVR